MTEPTTALRDLYPNYSDEEMKEIEYNLECYLALVLRIYERLESEGKLSEIEKYLRK